MKDSFLSLELEGVDVILRMQWLHCLGFNEVYRRNLVMTLQHKGRKVVIRGDPSLTKNRVSLKNMMKTCEADDQGFLVECQAVEGRLTVEEIYDEEVVPNH